MKLELSVMPPKELKESYPGQYTSIGRWFDSVVPIPMQVFLITTKKKNGLNNAQLNAWGMTIGSGKTPSFLFSDTVYSDTYKLIKENGEFVVNLFPASIREKAFKTTIHYKEDEDEVLSSGLTPIAGLKTNVCRVEECIAHYECKLEWVKDMENGHALICGKIVAISVNEEILSSDTGEKYKNADIMFYLKEPLEHENGWNGLGKTCYGKLSTDVSYE